MKKIIYCLLLSLFFITKGYSQEIIEHRGDTMIVISPENLKTINSIIVDLESSEKIIKLQGDIIKEDSIKAANLDSIIIYQSMMMRKKDDYYVNSIQALENSLKKEKRIRKLWAGALGCVAVILGALAISN